MEAPSITAGLGGEVHSGILSNLFDANNELVIVTILIASPDSPHSPMTLLVSISFLSSAGFNVVIAFS